MSFGQTLPNGLRVVVEEMPHMKSCAVSIWIGVGSRYESERINGISHFVEHLLFKGTRKRPDNQAISMAIESVGGMINGFTNKEVTCYLVKVPAQYLDLGLDVLSDMVVYSLFLPESIDRERGVVIEEIRMVHDKPDNWVHVLLDQLMWPGQAFGRSVAGTEEVIKSLSREDILRFVEQYYSPGNIAISVAGQCKRDDVIRKTGELFGDKVKREIGAREPVVGDQSKPRVDFEPRDTKQTNLAFGFYGYPRLHPDRYAMEMLNVALGWGMSSRLFQEVRVKRGLAYVVGSQYSYYMDAGQFKVYAGVDPRKSVDAVKVIMEELSRVSSEGISEEELGKAKEFYKGSLLLRLEDTLNLSLRIGESSILTGRVVPLEEVISKVDAVTVDDIRRVGKDAIRMDRLNLAAVGPAGQEEEIRKSVGA
ncbi:MAG TPA: insulinase family protein [Firmicutes bacterium]|nr:insulinase family protein [Bacillota bacterium]